MLFLKACTYNIDYTYLWSLIYLFGFFFLFFSFYVLSLFNHVSHSKFTVVYFSFDLMQWLIVSVMCVNERNRNTCIVKHPSSNIWTSYKKYCKCLFYLDVFVNKTSKSQAAMVQRLSSRMISQGEWVQAWWEARHFTFVHKSFSQWLINQNIWIVLKVCVLFILRSWEKYLHLSSLWIRTGSLPNLGSQSWE